MSCQQWDNESPEIIAMLLDRYVLKGADGDTRRGTLDLMHTSFTDMSRAFDFVHEYAMAILLYTTVYVENRIDIGMLTRYS